MIEWSKIHKGDRITVTDNETGDVLRGDVTYIDPNELTVLGFHGECEIGVLKRDVYDPNAFYTLSDHEGRNPLDIKIGEFLDTYGFVYGDNVRAILAAINKAIGEQE